MSRCPFHSASSSPSEDPFKAARESTGVLPSNYQGKPVPMILTHAGVREAARDWRTFSSDAPFRVPIPSEEEVRNMRQLPIETDPPEHTDYRRIAEPFFNRPKEPAMIAAVEALIGGMIADAIRAGSVEVVRELGIPLQSRALALLLNVPMTEAEEWIGWGTHVFREAAEGEKKGAALDRYIHRRLDEALARPGDDFFSALTQAEFRGRKLTREEQAGFVNLTFAGGRDTVIQSIAGVIEHLSRRPEHFAALREQPELVASATEEFLRYLSPITHIGRVCPVATDVNGVRVEAGERVSLVWASANRDASVFAEPNEVKLDRKPNPHLALGSGPHTCLGALHARLLIRTLLRELTARVAAIETVEAEQNVERGPDYARLNGFERLVVRFVARG